MLTLEHSFRPQAEQKRVGFTIACDPGLPEVIHTDPGRLEQIANNLIGNALKFTARGAVQVSLAPDGPDRMALVVRDSGIGIPVESWQRSFCPSSRSTTARNASSAARGWGSVSRASLRRCWAGR